MIIYYKDEDGWLGYTDQAQFISVHTEINKWSLSSYKKYLSVLANFLNHFKGKRILSLARTKKARKFNELFGFYCIEETETGEYVMEINNVWE